MDSAQATLFGQALPPRRRLSKRIGRDEFYTPAAIIDAARVVMGSIDLDIASCPEANEVVQAARYYTKTTDALDHCWQAETVWCNPPFGAQAIRAFTEKLLYHLSEGHIARACLLLPMTTGHHVLDVFGACVAFVMLHPNITGWRSPYNTSGRVPLGWVPFCVACWGVTVPETRSAFAELGVVR